MNWKKHELFMRSFRDKNGSKIKTKWINKMIIKIIEFTDNFLVACWASEI